MDRQAAGGLVGIERQRRAVEGRGRSCSPNRRCRGRPAPAARRGRPRAGRQASFSAPTSNRRRSSPHYLEAELDQHAVGRDGEVARLVARIHLHRGLASSAACRRRASTPSQGSCAATSSPPSGSGRRLMTVFSTRRQRPARPGAAVGPGDHRIDAALVILRPPRTASRRPPTRRPRQDRRCRSRRHPAPAVPRASRRRRAAPPCVRRSRPPAGRPSGLKARPKGRAWPVSTERIRLPAAS